MAEASARNPPKPKSLVVRALAVGREIETIAFARFGDAGAAEDGLDDHHGDEGHDTGPDDGDTDSGELDHELAADGVGSRITQRITAEAGRRDNRGAQGADDTANTMDTEHVEAVV